MVRYVTGRTREGPISFSRDLESKGADMKGPVDLKPGDMLEGTETEARRHASITVDKPIFTFLLTSLFFSASVTQFLSSFAFSSNTSLDEGLCSEFIDFLKMHVPSITTMQLF